MSKGAAPWGGCGKGTTLAGYFLHYCWEQQRKVKQATESHMQTFRAQTAYHREATESSGPCQGMEVSHFSASFLSSLWSIRPGDISGGYPNLSDLIFVPLCLDTLTFLFLFPTSGPLHLQSMLPGMLFTWTFLWLTPSYYLISDQNPLLRKAFPNHRHIVERCLLFISIIF